MFILCISSLIIFYESMPLEIYPSIMNNLATVASLDNGNAKVFIQSECHRTT